MKADVIVNVKVTQSTPTRGASTGAVGIAGIVKRPFKDGKVVRVRSYDEAERKLGGYMPESTLMYGLRTIFRKLGQADVYISPVTHRTTASDPLTETGKPSVGTIAGGTAPTTDLISVEHVAYGKEGDKYGIKISDIQAQAKTFQVDILVNGTSVKTFKEVMVSNFTSKVSHPDLIFTQLVNDDTVMPNASTFTLSGGVEAHTGVVPADYETALEKLAKKSLDFIIVDSTVASVGQKAIEVANRIKAVAYLNTPYGSTDAEAMTLRNQYDSKNGRLLHPHQWVEDPVGTQSKPNKAVPIAYEAVANQIRAFNEVGRRQVSAGTVYGALTGLGLTHVPDGDTLADTGVNYCIEIEDSGAYIWDATTLSKDLDWFDLNRVQLFNYIYKTLVPSVQPDLFRPSDPAMWNGIETRLSVPLRNLYLAGELYSNTGEESDAYYVQCNASNNPRELQLTNTTNVRVGYKDKKIAKWIVLDMEVS